MARPPRRLWMTDATCALLPKVRACETCGRITTVRVVAILGCSILACGIVDAPVARAASTLCVVKTEQPHNSGHFKGRINAIGKVACVGDPIPDMHLDVQIQRKVSGVWKVVTTSRTVLDHEPLFIRISRSLKCVSGDNDMFLYPELSASGS